jgi:hypothetical protein
MADTDAGMKGGSLRVKFVALWSVLQLAKIILAARLPLFVDEAFYAWESRHLAWAYSDLPGLTAGLIGLGRWLGDEQSLAVRSAFLMLGAAIPWLMVRITRRWFGAEAGWRAGLLALLMPLSGLLGLLALPDVALVFAALLCLDALARLRDRIDAAGVATLAIALAIGALSHYRFALVVLAGFVGVVCDARSRRLLRAPGFWLAIAFGAAAWWPLLQWNFAHAGAGLQFQLVDRNPWAFDIKGLAWPVIQAVAVTPIIFVWLVLAGWRLPTRRIREPEAPWGLLLGVAAVSVAGYFVLGFFADHERVSFHWPVAGWLVLVVAAAGQGAPVSTGWRRAGSLLALLTSWLVIAWLGAATFADARSRLATTRAYPADFSGTGDILREVDHARRPGERIVADNFEIAAQLVRRHGDTDLRVLDHRLNHKHGRAPQLALWRVAWRAEDAADPRPLLLVIEDSATSLKDRLSRYHSVCAALGPLPPPDVVEVDGGKKRYLLFHLPRAQPGVACVAPAIAQIDFPAPGAHVAPVFDIAGWAFKDGIGVARVDITLDGRPVAAASYGKPLPHVAAFWKISTDPRQPNVGLVGSVDAGGFAPGPHRLGLVVHGNDGSIEPWPAQDVVIEAAETD